MLMDTGENGMGSGSMVGAGGVAGLARLDVSPGSVSTSTSTSASSSISQNEDGTSLLCAPLPSRAASVWFRLSSLTEGLTVVDVVREVRLEMLRR